MILALHGESISRSNLLTHIRVTREAGYDAIELGCPQLLSYLEQGFPVESLLPLLEGLPVVALGNVKDIERQEPQEYAALLDECERMCSIAQRLGCPSVQLLTGPLGPGHGHSGGYQGLVGRPWPEVRSLTAKNLKVLADIGARYGVRFYLEPIAWTPLHSLQQGLEVIDAVERDNVGLVIDFWHLWVTGTTPDEIARLDKEVINGVHFCDSFPANGGPITHALREVWPGGGHIPLKEWVDAVKATGYDGWWSPELHSPRHWELDPLEVARALRYALQFMLY